MERAEQRENMSKKCNNTTGGWSCIPMRERNWKGLTRPHIEVSNPRVHDREGLMAMGDIQWSVSPLERFNDWFGISEGAQVASVAEYSARLQRCGLRERRYEDGFGQRARSDTRVHSLNYREAKPASNLEILIYHGDTLLSSWRSLWEFSPSEDPLIRNSRRAETKLRVAPIPIYTQYSCNLNSDA